MNEIEVKVLYINKNEIINKLEKLGARLVKNEEQINIRFDTGNSHLKNTYHGYLRIRITKNNLDGKITNTLTLKKNLSREKFRVNEEIETEISNVEETIKILQSLNLIKKKPANKHRISYIYDDILFEIDEWDKTIYPYPYLEIEVKDKDKLERAIDLLDLDRENVTAKPIDELLKEQ
ncbi:class IV adenylate cyclase [Sedimentibacter sp. zth1]|uniref:class IV adenylate cyclase n=1 Tax=Sedimentibacter sp. zth1 TaxID=2816908 RepID=UPI001A934476|nr:class IV adenylate cyclase [Sedimentibacter sp. zth1]QSX05489.1 class IV adenylate cyclase [Sedimentibacter sp. zth1]